MKSLSALALAIVQVAAKEAVVGDAETAQNLNAAWAPGEKLNNYVSPIYLSGFILFTFLFFMTYWAVMMLGAIETPSYQLPATDEKNKENNREWSHMWGNIEKS